MRSIRDPDLPDFQNALLRWYDEHRRDLPWRKTSDPYRIWLSEIMLQQTRVAAVLEHYGLFLGRFPDVRALAAATEQAVLAAWSGLGYYRRARMMRLCAQKIVREHGGCFPPTSSSLQTLPGIGRYTAAAIASISFAEPVAVVDGNVERVLQRMAGSILASTEMWRRAQRHLSSSRPADFNQAMMELGALVCIPRQPKCDSCPVVSWCASKGESARAASKLSQFKKQIWFALDERNQSIRLVQRSSESSLMPGMWELPELKIDSRQIKQLDAPAVVQRTKAKPASRKSLQSRRVQSPIKAAQKVPWRTFRHSITVTDYTVHVIRGQAPNARSKWIPIQTIPTVPLTGLTRKILKAAHII